MKIMAIGKKNIGNMAYMDFPGISFHTQEAGISS